MSLSLNSAVIGGNLTRDPELKYTSAGTALCKFSVAVNRRVKGEEVVSFLDVTCWDKTAENSAQYLAKGRQVIVEGEIRQDRWKNEAGENRSKIFINAHRVHFVGGREDSNGAGSQRNTGYPEALGGGTDDDLEV